jgi:hypothetical protein
MMIATSAGPEISQLVSSQGLFRLVLKSKSNVAKTFYDWADQISRSEKAAGVVEKKEMESRHGKSASKGDEQEIDPRPLLSAKNLVADFKLRNIIVEVRQLPVLPVIVDMLTLLSCR